MLADYCGIKVPTVLILNLMDVAELQGKIFDSEGIANKLDIPVVPFNATNKKDYETLFEATRTALSNNTTVQDKGLCDNLKNEFVDTYDKLSALLPQDGMGIYSLNWIISKLMDR